MHILSIFASSAILLDTALVQADVSQVLAQIPPCTVSSNPSLLLHDLLTRSFSSKNVVCMCWFQHNANSPTFRIVFAWITPYNYNSHSAYCNLTEQVGMYSKSYIRILSYHWVPKLSLEVSTAILRDEICKGIPQASRGAEIIRYITIIAAITFPVVFLRFYSRSLVASRMWWDDWVIGFAAVSP